MPEEKPLPPEFDPESNPESQDDTAHDEAPVDHKSEAEVMNNPLYCGNETSGCNPLFS